MPDSGLHRNPQFEAACRRPGAAARAAGLDLEDIFGVDRKGMLEGQAARGIERQVVVDAFTSRNPKSAPGGRARLPGRSEHIHHRFHIAITDGQAADGAPRRHVTLDQNRRKR